MEVEESKSRDKMADLSTFKSTVAAIKDSLGVIHDLKMGNDPTAPAEICEQRIFTSLAIAKLRKLNRLSHLGSFRAKDTTSEKRIKSDQYHLQLQNLLYEVGHLQKEINKCLEFRSKDEELNLVSVEEFYLKLPQKYLGSVYIGLLFFVEFEVTKTSEHELRKARLQWELEQRKLLANKLSETKKAIEESQNDIQLREAKLESLAPKLTKILEACFYQTSAGIPRDAFEQDRLQSQLAKYLPQPLFVLFKNLNALQYHDGKGNLTATIEGDMDSARSFVSNTTTKDEDSDSDQEEETHKVSKHRRRMASVQEENLESRVLKQHPLYINLFLQCRSSDQLPAANQGVKVQLYIYYMVNMNMVTVKSELVDGSSAACSVTADDLLEANSILSSIFPDDHGTTCPSSFSQSQLDKLAPSTLSNLRAKIGTPFRWAQRLAGLSVLSTEVTEPKLSSVSVVVKKLKTLVLNRVELVHQLADLEKCNLAVPSNSGELLPRQLPQTKLYHWSRCTFEDFSELAHADEYVKSGAVTPECIIYLAKLTCFHVKVLAHVSISGDYPSTRPIVLLKIEDRQPGECLTRNNSNAIRCIEREINLGKIEETESIVNQLNLQLVRLAWCCDVLIAVNTHETGSPQASLHVKFVPHCRRGRDRQLPLTYNSTTGFFGYSQ
ncbi:THOC5 [Bugula neritina]|uniref:THOC5 n=1 Tax=Bugula neritina TaxID=10212 RepID=A0A7J7JXF6_BUGNE|nr:THOC5 [Bugula neritina]